VSVAELVSHLKSLDVRLKAEGSRLRINAPKGVLSDRLRSQLAERKQELLEFLRVNQPQDTFVPPPIERRAVDGPPPLSFAQERLWFLEQLEPGSAVYNICRASRLTGQLNIAALELSLSEIVRRHEILRSQIRIVDGLPVQIKVAMSRFELPVIGLRSFTETEHEREVRDRIEAEAERQFDFSAGLFLRAVLLQIRNDEHILILTTHHIVADAWSMGILTRELWTLYHAYANGRPSPLQELAVQYANYAVWQREWLQGTALEAQLSYWRKQLQSLPVLNLPTDRPRPAKQSYRGARQPISLPESLTTAVNELSRREGVTVFMTLLAAFQVLLYRYSRQEDVAIGSPIANRSRTELEPMIGFFVNTLVLRTNLMGNPTFRELLLRVRDVCLGLYAHQDLPFEKLVEELQPERDLSRSPLFQVMFVLQNTPRRFLQPSGLSIERVEVLSATSAFDLSLYLREREGKLIGFFEYSTDLFNGSTIERLIDHFETLLEGIVADPEQPISMLPLLTEAERHQLLVEWNDSAADYANKCIYQLFEEQVEKTPDAIAVVFHRQQLTYRELNERANQLAHYLRGLGVGPELLVGICVERSLEMVIGLLGILKAGGAYVPLDPAYPIERLGFMLKDSQCSFLLTQQKIIEDGRWRIEDGDLRFSILDPRIKVVCLDSDWPLIAERRQDDLRSGVRAENLAYVIYTSGSTGQPKGVAIEHRNTVAFLCWAKSIFTANELAGVLGSTSICFDLSIFELFVPLSWGGKVVLAENALHLHSMTEKNEVTLINTVPSVMTELLAMGSVPKSVLTVNLAGELLRSEVVKQIYETTTVEKVHDLYGPSETTTYSTFTLRSAEGLPTIGRPISNTRIYIHDGNLQLVPMGVPGELSIGGAGVARGYLNRPDFTAERFISSSFNTSGGERIYRTGDLARYRPDGNIEFLGRMDKQVKIRGYRIELGEIEVVLNQHPTIKESVVVVRDRDSSGEKDLIAYFVPKEPLPFAVTGLRNFLRDKLPDYMLPSQFVELRVLPRSPNGKIDRMALRLPNDARPQFIEEFIAPRTEIEELVAQAWQEVLKVKNLGIDDNFFELGGHSLLAVQIISRLQDAFNREIPLRLIFEAPTVADLVGKLENVVRDGQGPKLPPIVPVPRNGPLPLSLNQEHLWRLDQMIPGTHLFNMPYVYQLSGDLKIDALEKALTELIRRHETLRTTFAEVDGRPVQVIQEILAFRLPCIDLRGESADDVSQKAADLILREREAPFDLAKEPLARLKLLRLTDSEYLLLVTMHHIISDHSSMQIFRRELLLLYDAFSQERPSPLTDPSIQFGDYAFWERRLLDAGLLNNQLTYWKKQLAGPASQLEFGKNGKPRREPNFHTARRLIELDGTLFRDIKALARRENCTPFMVLATALTILLHFYTGQRDIRMGALVANRGRRETEGVIGHFVNTVILRTYFAPETTLKQLLSQVRRVALMAYAHQELPFERLARLLEEDGIIDRGSLFQVLLNYQHHHFESPQIGGLTFASFDLQQSKEDADLTLTTFNLIINMRESSTTLTGCVNYKTDVIGEEEVNVMLKSFNSLLKNMTAHSVERIVNVLADGMG
jgi:amino acid adenylation domain-containing protein